MASEFYPDYPDPMPAFQYLGDHGKGLLESALAQPQQTYNGRFLYRTIFDKAAILFYSIIKNHPLLDGNKRIALATVAVFLVINEYYFSAPTDDTVQFCLYVATSDMSHQQGILKETTAWLRGRSIKGPLA